MREERNEKKVAKPVFNQFFFKDQKYFIFEVNENIIGAPKMLNIYGAIKLRFLGSKFFYISKTP